MQTVTAATSVSFKNMVQDTADQPRKHTLKNLLTVAPIGTKNLPVLDVKLFARFFKCSLFHIMNQVFTDIPYRPVIVN
jgi:hypothetical protein